LRILIAEDDPISRRLLERALESWGYEVVSAPDGEHAWRMLSAADGPALAILDRHMPGMDGTEICRRARASVDLQTRYLILLTAADRSHDVVQGLDAGADDYVAKPYQADELLARLRVGERVLGLRLSLESKIVELGKALANVNALVTFARALTEALPDSAIQQILSPHLAVLAPKRDVWILTRDNERWEPLFPDRAVMSEVDWGTREATATLVVVSTSVAATTDGGVQSGEDLCFPMVVGERVLGVLGAHEGVVPFEAVERKALAAIAALLAIALRNMQLLGALRDRSLRDSLTGCMNRGHGFDVLTTELQRAKRSGRPLSVVMFDIDNFKTLNDGYGHLCGDAVLVEVAHCLHRVLRKSDVKCRYGGDEFLVVLPDTPASGATKIAELLCWELSHLILPPPYADVSFGVSLGVATAAENELDGAVVLAQADRALYRAKAGGKGRVSLEATAVETTQAS
jgi:two-component system cell cycle response regulator